MLCNISLNRFFQKIIKAILEIILLITLKG